jgi:hypothetical protein
LSQTQIIVLLLKIGLISGVIVLPAWVAVYSKLTKGAAWRNPIGLSLIIEALLVAALFVPQILSLFFQMTRLDSRVAAWTDVVLIGLVTPVMLWRLIVFLRTGPGPGPGPEPRDPDRANLMPPTPQDCGQPEDCGQYGTG